MSRSFSTAVCDPWELLKLTPLESCTEKIVSAYEEAKERIRLKPCGGVGEFSKAAKLRELEEAHRIVSSMRISRIFKTFKEEAMRHVWSEALKEWKEDHPEIQFGPGEPIAKVIKEEHRERVFNNRIQKEKSAREACELELLHMKDDVQHKSLKIEQLEMELIQERKKIKELIAINKILKDSERVRLQLEEQLTERCSELLEFKSQQEVWTKTMKRTSEQETGARFKKPRIDGKESNSNDVGFTDMENQVEVIGLDFPNVVKITPLGDSDAEEGYGK